MSTEEREKMDEILRSLDMARDTIQSQAELISGYESKITLLEQQLVQATNNMERAYDYAASLNEECKEQRQQLDAFIRLKINVYQPWQTSGGENECAHGIMKEIPCARCDVQIVQGAVFQYLDAKRCQSPTVSPEIAALIERQQCKHCGD